MRIAKVEILVLDIPMIDSLMVSFGKIDGLFPIIIKITDELGNIGYGESILLPYPMTPFEYFDTGLTTLKNFIAPSIVGKEIILSDSIYTDIENFIDLYRHIHGYEMTKSGVQNAFVHLMTQRCDISLYDLFETKNSGINVGASIGIPENIDDYLDKINAFIDKGVQRIKLKIARGKDVLLISEVRNKFPDIELTIDANCDYDLDSFLDIVPLIDASNIRMVEQPFAHDNFGANIELKKVMKTPLCLDESIRSIQDVENYRINNGCDIVNIKIGRVGGAYTAYKINKYCESHNIGTWVGGLLETDLGRSFNLAIAGMTNCKFDNDFSAWDEYYIGHIMKDPYKIDHGKIQIDLSQKGIGYEVDIEMLNNYTHQSFIYE